MMIILFKTLTLQNYIIYCLSPNLSFKEWQTQRQYADVDYIQTNFININYLRRIVKSSCMGKEKQQKRELFFA